MKKIAVFLVVIVTCFILYQFLPPHHQDKIYGWTTFYAPERQCFNFYKTDLRDPHSAYLIGSYFLDEESAAKYGMTDAPNFSRYKEFLIIKVNAKNGFGAYGPVTFECPVKNKYFNETAALAHSLERKLNGDCKLDKIRAQIVSYRFENTCGPTDIFNPSNNCILLKGEAVISNACAQPIQIKVRLTTLDNDGKVINTVDYWPMGESNIQVGETTISLESAIEYTSNARALAIRPISFKTF